MMKARYVSGCVLALAMSGSWQAARAQQPAKQPLVLHAARLLEVDTGRIVTPGEILIEGERITAAGSSVPHPSGVQLIDLGDTTLLPGLIDDTCICSCTRGPKICRRSRNRCRSEPSGRRSPRETI